jgi:hypothetical protein
MVGPTVLSTTATGGDSSLRVYAHCTAEDNALGAGGVTLIVLNLADEDVTVRLWEHIKPGYGPFMWQLAPEDKAGPVGGGRGLNGTGVTLNGHPLRLIANNTYPSKSWGPPGDLMPDLTQFLRVPDPEGVMLTAFSITFINVQATGIGVYPNYTSLTPACDGKSK